MMKNNSPQFLNTPSGRRIAYHQTKGKAPGIIFLGGFKSDMTGSKALYLEQWARDINHSFIRFDYSGHGQSSETFQDGTIGSWLEDSQQVLTQLCNLPQVLVGSSMGGWLSLLLAKTNSDKVSGLVTIACATDFTTKLLKPTLTELQLHTINNTGAVSIHSDYDNQPYTITEKLLSEGDNHLLLKGTIPINCPVHMLHGTHDQDVPWQISLETMEQLESKMATLELIKHGDHRLSKEAELVRIVHAIQCLL